jgi:hypothetical protein
MDKYPKTLHYQWSPGTDSSDRFLYDTSTFINEPIVILEKLDGENNSFTNKGVYARSHAAFTTSPWSSKVRELHSIIKHGISEDLYIFGEAMSAIHSIEYTNLISHFYIFGARYNGVWSSWEEVEDYAFLLDLPTVPVLYKGIVKSEKELKELTEYFAKQESCCGGEREGIVCRLQREFTDEEFQTSVAKIVRKGHIQTNEHWTKRWQWNKNINIK